MVNSNDPNVTFKIPDSSIFRPLNVFFAISSGMGIITLARMSEICKKLKKVIFGSFRQFLHIFEAVLPVLLTIFYEKILLPSNFRC